VKTNINGLWPTIDPGEFRHQVTLLVPTTTTDASGNVQTFAAGAPPITAWAKIDYVRGTELIKAGQDVTQTYIKLTAWYRQEFKSNCRIQVPSGSQFLIQNVENVKEMNTFMVLMCLGIGETGS
jgi:SPP1 family predicted phage head-tail adaptor